MRLILSMFVGFIGGFLLGMICHAIGIPLIVSLAFSIVVGIMWAHFDDVVWDKLGLPK